MGTAILLTVLAGAATSLGGLVGIWGPHTSNRLLSGGLALSAGVMIYISLVELLPTALADAPSQPAALGAFLGGALLVLLFERLAGHHSPADSERQESSIEAHGLHGGKPDAAQVQRTGLMLAVVLAAHNAPEGFVTLITALQDPVMALPVAFAIAIHNIPEGIAVAVPVYHSTGNRWRAWLYATLSGLAEPAGALVLFAIVGPFLDPTVFGMVNAVIAGIMVFISLHELIPLALATGRKVIVSLWVFIGMMVMAVSLIALG